MTFRAAFRTLHRTAAFLLCGISPLAANSPGASDLFGQTAEIIDIIRGIHAFLSGIALVSETIGFTTILLFLAVILFSAGFSALGVPRGAPSFITALVAANALWILWCVSARTPAFECAAAMVRSNLIIAAPAIVVAVAARGIPRAAMRLRGAFRGLFKSRAALDGEDAATLFREYQEKSSRLASSMADDLAASRDKPSVSLSGETAMRARELMDLLGRIGNREDA